MIDGDEDGEVLLHYRVGVLWWHIAQLVIPGTAAKRFKQYNTIQYNLLNLYCPIINTQIFNCTLQY